MFKDTDAVEGVGTTNSTTTQCQWK